MTKITTQAAIRLVEALQHFDALPNAIDGTPTRKPYRIAGPVRMAMAKNIARLAEVVGAYQKARNALIYEHADGGNAVKPDKITIFEKANQDLLDTEHDVNLIRFREELLQLDDNEVPVSVLAALMPIMLDAGESGIPVTPIAANDALASPVQH